MNKLIPIASGEPNAFFILSSISEIYPESGKLALGSFQICIRGVLYGVGKADATLLACSFDEVNRRLNNRGKHCSSFPNDATAEEIASSFLMSVYCDTADVFFLGFRREKFIDDLYENFLVWAPDGDQAFDDGSVVLQLDIGDKVRLIGFKRSIDDPMLFSDLQDIYLGEDVFYGVLEEWISTFITQRQMHLGKTAEPVKQV